VRLIAQRRQKVIKYTGVIYTNKKTGLETGHNGVYYGLLQTTSKSKGVDQLRRSRSFSTKQLRKGQLDDLVELLGINLGHFLDYCGHYTINSPRT
jgi:hypothetical protein